MNKVISIDPSGTGTSGLFFPSTGEFTEFHSKEWKEHLTFIRSKVQQWQPSLLLYEHTNYIGVRGKDMTSLFKLFGGIEGLTAPGLAVASVPAHQVKGLKAKLLKGLANLPELTYQIGRGKGWIYRGKRISVHQLDALLVWWIWKNKQ